MFPRVGTSAPTAGQPCPGLGQRAQCQGLGDDATQRSLLWGQLLEGAPRARDPGAPRRAWGLAEVATWHFFRHLVPAPFPLVHLSQLSKVRRGQGLDRDPGLQFQTHPLFV